MRVLTSLRRSQPHSNAHHQKSYGKHQHLAHASLSSTCFWVHQFLRLWQTSYWPCGYCTYGDFMSSRNRRGLWPQCFYWVACTYLPHQTAVHIINFSFSACVSSILRLWAFMTRDYSSPDLTWTTVNPSIWSCVEGNIAIISACLPSLRPILAFVRHGFVSQAPESKASQTALVRAKSRPAYRSRSWPQSHRLNVTDSQLGGLSFEEAIR